MNRGQHFPPVSERNAELFEILITQMSEDGNIYVIFGKTLGILGKTEFLEPFSNLQQWVASLDSVTPRPAL